MTFHDLLMSGGLVGLIILLLILALSIIAVYLVVDHLMTVRSHLLNPPGFAQQVSQLVAQGKVVEAEKLCQEQPSFLAFVLSVGLSELPAGWSAMEKAMEDATAEQSSRLFRRIEYLSVIGNIAPMLGLLGTVTGMILAFKTVAETQGAAGAADLAEGIYQALITTVGGLVVAIPALGAFAVFRNRLDQLVAEVCYTAQQAFLPWRQRRMRAAAATPSGTTKTSGPSSSTSRPESQ